MIINAKDHIPVLLKPVADALFPIIKTVSPASPRLILDATFGNGGYTSHLLTSAPSPLRVIGLDRDPHAFARAEYMSKLPQYENRLTPLHGRFSQITSLLQNKMGYETPSLDAILFDIGMSSNQLSDPSRGFSYQLDGPLDMRMSNHSETALTAETIVNTFSEEQLAQLIQDYGQDRQARKIARSIVHARQKAVIHSTHQLSDIITKATSGRTGQWPYGTRHPAVKTFQALRIYINEELDELKQGLIAAEKWLKPNGLCIVVSFHSLEDAIVKSFFKTCEKGQAETYRRPNRLERAQLLKEKKEREMQWDPASLMVPAESLDVDNGTESSPRFLPSFVSLGNKVVKPTRDEQMENSRSRSAKMRVAQRTEHAPHFSSKAPFSAAL